MVGLYLNPPANAIVLCVDEKSQIQALNRTQPILPMRPGLPEKATHDYQRNGTATLFAALEIATGKVTDRCYERHGKAEFLDFLKAVARAYPRRRLHVVCDNYHTHKHADINAWLAKNSTCDTAFHPDVRVVAEPGRGVLLDHHPPSHPPRFLQQRQRTASQTIGDDSKSRSAKRYHLVRVAPRPQIAMPAATPEVTAELRRR